MIAPPGYPKTTSTPSLTRTSQTICAPVLLAARGFSRCCWTTAACDMRDLLENKNPRTGLGAGARILPKAFFGQFGGPHPLLISGSSPTRTRLRERESVSSLAEAAVTAVWKPELIIKP